MRYRGRHIALGAITLAAVGVVAGVTPLRQTLAELATATVRGVLNWQRGSTARPLITWADGPEEPLSRRWNGASVYYWDGGSFQCVRYVRRATDRTLGEPLQFVLINRSLPATRVVAHAYEGPVTLEDLWRWLRSDAALTDSLQRAADRAVEAFGTAIPTLVARHGGPVLDELLTVTQEVLARHQAELQQIAAELAMAVSEEIGADPQARERVRHLVRQRLTPALIDIANRVEVRAVLRDVLRDALARTEDDRVLETLQNIAEGQWLPRRDDFVRALVAEVDRVLAEPSCSRRVEAALSQVASDLLADPQLQSAAARALRRKVTTLRPRLRRLFRAAFDEAVRSERLRDAVTRQLQSPGLRRDLLRLGERLRTIVQDELRKAVFDKDGQMRPAVAFVLRIAVVREGEPFILLRPAESPGRLPVARSTSGW